MQQPLIEVQLTVTDERIDVSPAFDRIHHMMEEVINLIINVSTEIPRVERFLLPGRSWMLSILNTRVELALF